MDSPASRSRKRKVDPEETTATFRVKNFRSADTYDIIFPAALAPVPLPQSIPTSVVSPFGCDWPLVECVWPSTHAKAFMSFDTLGLSEALLRAVSDQGYTTPTPIQMQAIPAVLAGGELLAGAQTGTGKTAGFVLPMLHRLSSTAGTRGHAARRPLRALILTPTRELAAQVEASVKAYGKHLKLTSFALFGGVGFGPQVAQLRRGVDILVATPGRLLDHHGQRNVDFSAV